VGSFVDQAQIEIFSGKGGAGCVSFRREKFVPRGGPDGGDGGKGGDVIIRASAQQKTLLDFKYRKIYKAGNGRPGSGNNRHGKDGRSVIIDVPLGTMIIDAESQELLADMVEPKQKYVIAIGGRGGKGNAQFVSATHQAPRYCQPGEPEQSRIVNLELKLIADIGLVGFPNAGKSTFISIVSKAKPKIANYPFTTLTPNLGVVRRGADREFIIADIPGIIEGSHDGKGLGDQFLRHIERSAALLLMIDISDIADPPPDNAISLLINELDAYKSGLDKRIVAVAATKTDAVSEDYSYRIELLKSQSEKLGLQFFQISAVTDKNVREILNYLEKIVSDKADEDNGE